jgi:hypothetical protein
MSHLQAAWDACPLWGVFIATVVLVLLSIEAGLRLGRRRQMESGDAKDAPIGGVVGALLGLLAFLLAFTFGAAASRFDARRHLLLDEVNAIGTTYLRAGVIAEPERSELRKLLREYVAIRADLAEHPERLAETITRSEALHGEFWDMMTVVAQADPHSVVAGRLMESMNEMIDLHTERVTVGLRHRISPVIWTALYFTAALSMVAVGYQFGLSGARNVPMSVLLALTFSAVILLIADLDRATEGTLQVSLQPMLDLHKSLSGDAP